MIFRAHRDIDRPPIRLMNEFAKVVVKQDGRVLDPWLVAVVFIGREVNSL